MNSMLFVLFSTGLFFIYFLIGIYISRSVKSDTDYFLANRSLGTLSLSCNLIATQLGGGLLLGTALDAYTSGFWGIAYTLGIIVGFILLALGIASKLQQYRTVTTTAQLFELKYNSATLKKLASLMSIITLYGILVAQVAGFKALLISAGITSTLAISLFWLSIVIYTVIGGLRAITINDMLQLAIITLVFGGLFIYLIIQESASFFSWTNLAQMQASFNNNSSGALTWKQLFPIIVMPALFSLFEQDLAQRFFAAKSQSVATLAALYASIFMLIFSCIPVYLGMKAKLSGIVITPGQSPLISFLSTQVNEVIVILALCAIVAAIISTADALMNAVSANLTQDFNIYPLISKKSHLIFSKLTTLLIGTSALIVSYLITSNIISIIIKSYEISVSCLLVPFLAALYCKKVSKAGAVGAFLGGAAGFMFFKTVSVSFILPEELITLLISLAGFILGSLIYKNN